MRTSTFDKILMTPLMIAFSGLWLSACAPDLKPMGTAVGKVAEGVSCALASALGAQETLPLSKEDTGFLMGIIEAAKKGKITTIDLLRKAIGPQNEQHLTTLIQQRYDEENKKRAMPFVYTVENYVHLTLHGIIQLSSIKDLTDNNWNILLGRSQLNGKGEKEIHMLAISLPFSTSQKATTKSLGFCDEL